MSRLSCATQQLSADLVAQVVDEAGFPQLYMAADVEEQWQIRQILSVSDHHHLDEVMSAWDRADAAQREAVRAALGVA
tara:strand:+ start:461 stop:694 length:234 start_codon:yes stop_codon:yes gene_type:complete